MGQIKNTEVSAMSVGSVAVQLQYSLYVFGYLSKFAFHFMFIIVRLFIVVSSVRLACNVLELCLVRFETFSYRNITDKDTMFVAICKAKIIVPAKRPLLQMLCCPPALGKGAVTCRRPHAL